MAATESKRCLGCRALCMKCVEVCPNRANTLVRVTDGFRDEAQIVHIDAFCNECGNCATFCPWEGRPYRDKLTVFATEEDFRDSTNPGFFLAGGKGQVRLGGRTGPLAVDAGARINADSTDMEKPARAICQRDRPRTIPGCSEAPHDRPEKCDRRPPAPRGGDPRRRRRDRRHGDPLRGPGRRGGRQGGAHHRPRRAGSSCRASSAATTISTRASPAASWRRSPHAPISSPRCRTSGGAWTRPSMRRPCG